MRPKRLDLDVADANLTGFASNITGAGPFTMTTTATPDGLAHQVSIRNDSTTDHSDKTFTLTGTDADGKAITETVTGPESSATVESTKYFKTLSTVSVSATLGDDTMDVGWVDEVASRTIPLEYRTQNPPTIQVKVTGTINFDVETTADDVFLHGESAPFDYDEQADFTWLNDANFTAKTASLVDDLAVPGNRAMRLVINSYTDGAELQVNIVQPR